MKRVATVLLTRGRLPEGNTKTRWRDRNDFVMVPANDCCQPKAFQRLSQMGAA
jgi:hypothetical protein